MNTYLNFSAFLTSADGRNLRMTIVAENCEEKSKLPIRLYLPADKEMESGDASSILCSRGLAEREQMPKEMPQQSKLTKSPPCNTDHDTRHCSTSSAQRETHCKTWPAAKTIPSLSRVQGFITCVEETGVYFFQLTDGNFRSTAPAT